MKWQKVLFLKIYLVVVIFFLVGCTAPKGTPTTPAITFVTVTSTGSLIDASKEPVATATPVARATEATIVGSSPPSNGTTTPVLTIPVPTDTPITPVLVSPTDTPVSPTLTPLEPDLVIQSFKILQYGWPIIGGFEATAEVVVKNVGSGSASAFDVAIVGVNREDKYVRFNFSYDPALTTILASGQELTLTGGTGLSWHGHFDTTCADENYDATVCAMHDVSTLWLMAIVDYCEGDQASSHCAVEELNETNNTQGPVIIEKAKPPTPIPPTDTPILPTDTPILPTDTPVPPLPIVILMDSSHPTIVYHKETSDAGGTNADDVAIILADFPIETRKETTSSTWWDEVGNRENIRNQNPDLIIIHGSAFYNPNGPNNDDDLNLFLNYMKDTSTKFLIYSRASVFEDEVRAKGILEDMYDLYGRLDVLYVKRRWDENEVSQKLEDKVRLLLGLN